MSTAIETLQTAQRQAMANRPKVGGFPFLAETLRQAGVRQNIWSLPSCQSIYVMDNEAVVQQGTPLIAETTDVPDFNEAALISALRADQAGESTFPEFLAAAWRAGVTWYRVDFSERTVTYGSYKNETYVESYPVVEI
jgi:uncharacterized protein YbcV (DUF1398 family)